MMQIYRCFLAVFLTPEQVIHDQSKPYMQMRFSLVNKYNEVVKEEAAFIYSIKQELAIATNYSEANFQNMKVQKGIIILPV
jgi:hypothetical protein